MVNKIKKKEEQLQKLCNSYKEGYNQSLKLNYEMLNSMESRTKINLLFYLIWFLIGLVWGMMIVGWFG